MPKDPIKEYADRIDAIMHSYFPSGMEIRIQGVDEAKLFVGQCDLAKKELALLKKEIAVAKKADKAEYASARADVQSSSAGSRLFGSKVGGFMRGRNMMKRADLRQNEQADMARYDTLIAAIDRRTIDIDRAKIQVKQALDGAK